MDDREDPDWKSLSLEMISKLQDPVNGMILSWNDWYMGHNALGKTENWDPEHNPHHMIRSEISDLNKAMTQIRMLEAKLSREGPNTGTTSFDWNLLNSLKREVGIPVEFGSDKKALAGEGNIPSKAMVANLGKAK